MQTRITFTIEHTRPLDLADSASDAADVLVVDETDVLSIDWAIETEQPAQRPTWSPTPDVDAIARWAYNVHRAYMTGGGISPSSTDYWPTGTPEAVIDAGYQLDEAGESFGLDDVYDPGTEVLSLAYWERWATAAILVGRAHGWGQVDAWGNVIDL